MFATLMAYTIPMGIEHMSWKFYIINACWNIVILVVIWKVFVETKGKTMEEINIEFEGIQGMARGTDGVLTCTSREADAEGGVPTLVMVETGKKAGT